MVRHCLVIAIISGRIRRVILAMEILAMVEVIYYANALAQLRTLRIVMSKAQAQGLMNI
jgi:hypothetical protein